MHTERILRGDPGRALEAPKKQSPALNIGVLGELGMCDTVLGGSEESYVQLGDQPFFLMKALLPGADRHTPRVGPSIPAPV